MNNKILVIEDEASISELICMNLMVAGYQGTPVYDGKDAVRLLEEDHQYDLALVDIMLPGLDGFALMEYMQRYQIPVIYLTAKDDLPSKIKGLKSGAEDYIVKPFEVLELLVRIEKVLERHGALCNILEIGDIAINLASHLVEKAGLEISLKPLEYDLLVTLIKHKNRTLTRNYLLETVWGDDFLGETRTVDVHIGQIRKKLGLENKIKTIPKVGYRLED